VTEVSGEMREQENPETDKLKRIHTEKVEKELSVKA
jgi:hypothetical protein